MREHEQQRTQDRTPPPEGVGLVFGAALGAVFGLLVLGPVMFPVAAGAGAGLGLVAGAAVRQARQTRRGVSREKDQRH